MSTLNEYLGQKREAVLARNARDPRTVTPVKLRAHVSAEGRSGVRRIRIRDHQVVSDSPADFAGYDLGPSSPELLLGSLGSCLTHIFLIKAAELELPLDSLEV
ncbi:OsmC family peroxiredoxin, partial [Achromobacter ruhlandii]